MYLVASRQADKQAGLAFYVWFFVSWMILSVVYLCIWHVDESERDDDDERGKNWIISVFFLLNYFFFELSLILDDSVSDMYDFWCEICSSILSFGFKLLFYGLFPCNLFKRVDEQKINCFLMFLMGIFLYFMVYFGFDGRSHTIEMERMEISWGLF